MTLTAKQHGMIAVARKQLGLAEDDYRTILRNACGVESATQLDNIGFDLLMQELRRLGFSPTKKGLGYRDGMATPQQLGMIRGLWRDLTGGADESGLRAWLERTAKVSSLRFLDRPGAHAMINALRAAVARKGNAA